MNIRSCVVVMLIISSVTAVTHFNSYKERVRRAIGNSCGVSPRVISLRSVKARRAIIHKKIFLETFCVLRYSNTLELDIF